MAFIRSLQYLALVVAGCTPTLGDFDPSPDAGAATEPVADARACQESVPLDVTVRRDPPDLMIVLDRSGSMAGAISGQEKWTTMRTALSSLTAQADANIKFGLAMYPSDSDCAASQIHIAAAIGNAGAITTKLGSTSPNGNTPTHKALGTVRAHFLAQTAPNPAGRYVLLATDGLPNCGGGATESRDAILQLKTMGIPTYVIGFGDVAHSDPTVLRSWAMAGGTTDFFPASSPAALTQALASITHDVATPSCNVVLPTPPDHPADLRISIGGTPVSRGTPDGWDYDPATKTVTFHGASCAQITAGTVQDVQVFNSCDPVIQ